MHSTERKHFETNTPDSGASGIRKPRLMRAFLSGTVIGVLVVTFGQATATRTPVPVSKHSPARRIFASVDAAKRQAIQSYSESPLSFEPNQGQTGARVQFLSRGPGYAMLLTPDEAVLRLRRRTDPPGASTAGHLDIRPQASPQDHETLFRMKFVGANPNAKTVSLEELPGKANYLIGNDPKKWHTGIPMYARVRYQNVYPRIDLTYYGTHRQLEYDLLLRPGADVKAITLSFEGADGLDLDAQGSLVWRRAGVEMRQHKPVVYQEIDGRRREIQGAFVLKENNRVGFQVASYDSSKPLIIDPALAYSTYLGGSTGSDFGLDIAVDAAGAAYVTGYTFSTDFPATTSGLYTTANGDSDVFVTKFNADGSALIYSTYLGGSGAEEGRKIAVDLWGNAYVTGSTFSTNFPTTTGALDTTANGDADAFITKLNTGGSALVYSTYLGGVGYDRGAGIAVDLGGAAVVTGFTLSADFPTTLQAFDTSYNGGTDAFVTKINASGSALVYSTYFGGAADDFGLDVAVDLQGAAYVTGDTASIEFPVTPGSFDTSQNGNLDGFVMKLNAGGALVYSTYLGGAANDFGVGIAVDATGAAYVTGSTQSTDFPTTSGAFATTANGDSDAFVAKLDAAGSALVYSTYLGGIAYEEGRGIAVDATGAAYVTGSTQSPNFPTSSGFLTALNGPSDLFVTKLNSRGSALVYSTYLGGSDSEEALGHGIALDGTGAAYVTGSTYSTNFPVTSRGFHTSSSGFWEAVVVKITDPMVPSAAPQPVTAPPPVSLPVPVPGLLPVPLP